MNLICEVCGQDFQYDSEVGYSKTPPICGRYCDGRRYAQGELTRLAADLLEAHAIIDKLPRTKDGAVVVPGMPVYYAGTHKILKQFVGEDLHLYETVSPPRERTLCWYSTRVAAEGVVAAALAAAQAAEAAKH